MPALRTAWHHERHDQTGGAATYIIEVLNNMISIADTISTSIEDSYCEEYPAG